MEVVILGSGTAVPVPDRFPSAYLVRHAGTQILVDLGPGVLRRAAQAGLDLVDLDHVLLTHYHTDHSADLAALLFALRNPRYSGRKKLTIHGAPGLLALLDDIRAAWPWCQAKDYEFEPIEIEPGEFALGSLSVSAVAIEHTDASLGYRLTTDDGKSAAFSGDAIYCEGVVDVARGVDVFICDSAFPTAAPQPGHMTPTEAGRAAQRAGVGRLCLTHFYPECEGHDLRSEASSEFDGSVVLAQDLHVFDLDSGSYSPLPR